jgi:amicoumacin kinase
MDPKIAARFNDQILQSAIQHYAISPDKIHLLDGFESFIYEYERPDGAYILRIGHSQRRNENLIQGEVDWINFLAAGGASVAKAVLSEEGNLVEPVEDGQGDQFLCTAFIKAPGCSTPKEQINDRLFTNYGRLLGQMHSLTKRYVLPNPQWKRAEWDDPENIHVEACLPAAGYEKVLEFYFPLMAHLSSLPRQLEGFGMIHQDAHPGNFFVDPDYNITLFDFDDCVFGHFIYDIAMALMYSSGWGKDPLEFTARFMPVFLSGYREKNRLDPVWLKELPHFLKLREIDLFAQILFSFPDESYKEVPWPAWYMNGRKEKIESGLPFIDYDWASLEKYL